MLKSLITTVTTIMMLSPMVQANMRAPRIVEYAPSYSLSRPPGDMLTVQNETLNIDCDYVSCDVQAVYKILSAKPAELEFAFILPTDTPVEARVAGSLQLATVTPNNKYMWEPTFSSTGEQPLFQAVFRGKVSIGTNIITIKYQQPLMIREYDYGYFSSGRSVESFTYQLGPLKQWQLDKDFSLEINLSSLRKRPERDGGWSLRKSRPIDCKLAGQVVENDSDNLNLTVKLGKKFPDNLICKIGDSDLLIY